MKSLQSKSILSSVQELSFATTPSVDVIHLSRSYVEHLASSYQGTIDPIEKTKLIASFFSLSNKTYTRLHTLSKSKLPKGIGSQRILLLPEKGWVKLENNNSNDNNDNNATASSHGDFEDDDFENEDEDEEDESYLLENERIVNVRPCIVRGRFWTDQITSNLTNADVKEILHVLQPMCLWDIFYQLSCLCEDPNDSFRILWILADHLNSDHKNNTLDIQRQLTNPIQNNIHHLQWQTSLSSFCKMLVNSLRQLVTNITENSINPNNTNTINNTLTTDNNVSSSTTSSTTSNTTSSTTSSTTMDTILMAMRCLNKLIGILSSESSKAWSSLLINGAMTTLQLILFRHKHFNNNGVINSITAMHCICQQSLALYDQHEHIDDQTVLFNTELYNLWRKTTSKLANDVSEVMYCVALTRVMRESR